MAKEKEPSLLLELPDPCLLAVLRFCAQDQRSLLSAARAHSRLHQAAVLVLSSIKAVVTQQQQADSVHLYLDKHGHHRIINSLELKSVNHTLSFTLLPQNLQLASLLLEGLCLGSHLVLETAKSTALKQLQLSDCTLFGCGANEAFAAALSQVPGLEHLSIKKVMTGANLARGSADADWVQLPTAQLARLQALTYLELANIKLLAPSEAIRTLQPLQTLTGLVELRLGAVLTDGNDSWISPSMLSDMQHLTRLELKSSATRQLQLEPDALAGKTQLQHLSLFRCAIVGWEDRLLSHLKDMQQLTHLSLRQTLRACIDDPPPESYAALTASSKLQYLNISGCCLATCMCAAGAWEHIFPAGRQLPNLQELNISALQQFPLSAHPTPAPDGSRLVSCCPDLRHLNLERLQYSTEMLAGLRELSALVSLQLGHHSKTEPAQGMELVCELEGLRELSLSCTTHAGLLLQLKQLTRLEYRGLINGLSAGVTLASTAPGDEPVSCQVLRLHLNHSDPEVASLAAAALSKP